MESSLKACFYKFLICSFGCAALVIYSSYFNSTSIIIPTACFLLLACRYLFILLIVLFSEMGSIDESKVH